MNTFILRRICFTVLVFLMFLFTIPTIQDIAEADVITWRTDTAAHKDSVDITWISAGNPNTKRGVNDNMLLGIDPVDNIDHFLIRIHCNGVLDDGNNLDSIRIRTFVRNSELYNDLFGGDDTVYCHLYKITSGDADWIEGEATYNRKKNGSLWDTAGVGLGNDAVAVKSKAFTDDASMDSTREFRFDGEATIPADAHHSQIGFETDQIDGAEYISIWLPVEDYRTYIDGTSNPGYIVKATLHDDDSDGEGFIQLGSDDHSTSNEWLYVDFFWTDPSGPSGGNDRTDPNLPGNRSGQTDRAKP